MGPIKKILSEPEGALISRHYKRKRPPEGGREVEVR
jgi:hypothetical protein